MAETIEKKYLSLDKLGKYNEKIKGVISAGDAATLQGAKDYADGLAVNYDAAGAAAGALESAKAYADGKDASITAAANAAAAAQTQADKGVADAATAQAAADAAQADINELTGYVGTIPTTATATDVVGYINEKTSGIATDAALGELQGKVATAEDKIKAIEDDYLTSTDKTELQGNIDAVDTLVDTLVGTDTGKSVRTIANEELVAQLIPEAAQESLDTLTEIANWIQAHPDSASAMARDIADLEALVGTLPEGITQTNVVAYAQALVTAEQSRAEDAEAGLDGRIDTLEAKFGTGDGSVADMIADAKQEAIDAAASDATSKANQALTDAKAYAGQEDAKIITRVEALEAVDHSHANATELDKIVDGDVAKWNTAAGKAHVHENAAVLAGITQENITTWSTVTSKAAQTDLEAAVARIAANETAIASFVEISDAEINGLFTA